MSAIERPSWYVNQTLKEAELQRAKNGVVIVVQALPTVDSAGDEYVGGVGESTIGGNLHSLLPDAEYITSGKAMRAMVRELAIHKGDLQPGDDYTEDFFYNYRERIKDTPVQAKLDRLLDKQIYRMVCQALEKQETEARFPVVILESKVAGVIIGAIHDHIGLEDRPLLYTIGVTADNQVATERFVSRQMKSDLSSQVISEALRSRKLRRQTDENNYVRAHPYLKGSYNRQVLQQATHTIVDNTMNLSQDDLLLRTREILKSISNQLNQKLR